MGGFNMTFVDFSDLYCTCASQPMASQTLRMGLATGDVNRIRHDGFSQKTCCKLFGGLAA